MKSPWRWLRSVMLPPVAALTLGCHPQVREADAILRLRVEPPQAVVYVDDIPVPIPPGQPGSQRLRPGLHRVEVRADGWFTAYREVSLPPGAVRKVAFTLRKDPDAQDPSSAASSSSSSSPGLGLGAPAAPQSPVTPLTPPPPDPPGL